MFVLDYVILVVVVLISLGIGVYYSLQQSTLEEYINAKHNMRLLPVGMSMAATFVSATSTQGHPAEVYLYGVEIAFSFVGVFIGVVIINYTFLPLYFELKPTTIFQYLEKRYESKLPKMLGCILGVLRGMIYSGVVLFGPAFALERMTGIGTAYNIVIIMGICTVYTALGGIQGVVWSDLFQGFIMVTGLVVIIIASLTHINVPTIWHELEKHGKSELNTSLNVTQRLSVWICAFGFTIRALAMFTDQPSMMRYTGLKTLSKARLSTFLTWAFFMLLEGLAIVVGIVVFAFYSTIGCGPLESGEVHSPNQIITHFVLDIIQYQGMSGLFVSVLVSGTMSTLSSLQNATTILVWRDLLVPVLPKVSSFTGTVIMKVLVVVYGVVVILIAMGAMHIGGTFTQIVASLFGATEAPALGMFVLGACFTFTSSIAVVIGCLVSSTFMLWIAFGEMTSGNVWQNPTYINETCSAIFENMTHKSMLYSNYIADDLVTSDKPLVHLYSISPFLYHALGLAISFIIGLLLSLLPCLKHKKLVKENLLIPFVRKFARSKCEEQDLVTCKLTNCA